jgi:hypothetical protein
MIWAIWLAQFTHFSTYLLDSAGINMILKSQTFRERVKHVRAGNQEHFARLKSFRSPFFFLFLDLGILCQQGTKSLEFSVKSKGMDYLSFPGSSIVYYNL